MGEQGQRRDGDPKVSDDTLLVYGIVVLVALFVWLLMSLAPGPPQREHADYMVSINDVDGLNLDVPMTTTMLSFLRSRLGGVPTTMLLSPAFNLTVRIENPGNTWRSGACVLGLSTAVVSYGDAFLGKGSVPSFCAKDKEVQERVATAWGEDVVLPRFLRECLSAELERGEALLDVQVIMPGECSGCSDKVLVCNKVMIGGSSPSPCRVEEVRPMRAAGSTH